MRNLPINSPEQLQSAYHQAVELAYLVTDTLSITSLKELWKRSDFSALDKEMLRMLRSGSERGKEKTASELVEAMHNEAKKSSSTTALVIYDPLTPLFQKRLKKMRELFAKAEVRREFFKGFNDRREHREVLALGKEGTEQVHQLDEEQKTLTRQKHTLMLEKFFKGVKMSDFEKSTINEALIEIDDQLSALVEQKDALLQTRETATVWRLDQLRSMKRKDGYVMTPSRQSIFDNAVEKFLEGNHILLKGDTGSGKTAIAVQIAKYIEELSEGKIKTMQIDGKKLEKEARDPEKLRKAEQMVFSGNPFTTQSDLIGKSKLIGDIEMEFQYSKLLTAFMEGRVLIFDELDSVPGDVLYRIKHLFEQKPMSLYAPQENGGEWKALLQTKIIATANIHSEDKYRDKEKIPVPVQDNFVAIEVPYMPKEEIYDFSLVEMMSKEGFIKGVGEEEVQARGNEKLTGKKGEKIATDGVVVSLIECIDQIEQLFTGKTLGALNIGAIDNNAEYSLKYAIWTMRSLIPLFREWKGKDLNARIKTEIVDFIAKATDPDDRKVLLKVFAGKGFLGKQNLDTATAYKHRNGTLSLAQVLHLPESDLMAILAMDETKFPESTVAFLDPYEVAHLDPYHKRNLDSLTSKNPFMDIKHQLNQVYTSLSASTDSKVEQFAQFFAEKIEKAEQAGEVSPSEVKEIMEHLYDIYDKNNDTLAGAWSALKNLGENRKGIAKEIEKQDGKGLLKKKKFGQSQPEKPLSPPQQQSTVPGNMATDVDTLKNQLLHKPGMNAEDKQNMQSVIDFLAAKNILTKEHLQKLYSGVEYGDKNGEHYRSIDGIKFSANKLVPQVTWENKNKRGVYTSNTTGVWKYQYNGKDEYYLSMEAYQKETKKQRKKAVERSHLEQALKALPGVYPGTGSWYKGGNILSMILGMSMSGYMDSNGKLGGKDSSGSLGSASPSGSGCSWRYEWYKTEGFLGNWDKTLAFPCLFLLE